MSLEIGNVTASSGMSLLIYQQMDSLLSPPLQQAVSDADEAGKPAAQEALDKAREGWQKLAYAIANGVIGHLLSNLEINGVQAQGDVTVNINGNTGNTDGHQHSVNISDSDNNVVFTQINNGTGLIS